MPNAILMGGYGQVSSDYFFNVSYGLIHYLVMIVKKTNIAGSMGPTDLPDDPVPNQGSLFCIENDGTVRPVISKVAMWYDLFGSCLDLMICKIVI